MSSLEIRNDFADMLEEAITHSFPSIKLEKKEITNSIVVPKSEHGDLSSSITFLLARHAKSSPMKIAEQLLPFLKKKTGSGLFKDIKNLNGYLNLWLDEAHYSELILKSIKDQGTEYGNSKVGKKKRVIVEYPSVNPNKPWHVGHLRNPLLGDSISNILMSCSYDVERNDYIDDLGFQMAEILWGLSYMSADTEEKYDKYLGELYVKVNEKIKAENAEPEINEMLKKMEQTESEEARFAREISEKSVKAQYQTAFSYGIYHDVMIWESDIVRNKLLEKAMKLLEQKKVSRVPDEGKYKGCVVVDVAGKENESDEEEGVKVFIRSNGVATYIAKDFAYHLWKFGILRADFKYKEFVVQPNGKPLYSSAKSGKSMDFGSADMAVNIIGSKQKYPQAILKEVLKALGYNEESEKMIHLAYGEVDIKEGSLSGRSGAWLGSEKNYTADDLLREMSQKTLDVMKKAEKVIETADENKTATKIALSAIKFEYLRIDPEKKVVFEWEKALDLNSNSGPYCLYMYARASRILEKAGLDAKKLKLKKDDYKKIEHSYDFELIKLIGSAQEIVEKACKELRPNVVAEYLIDISLAFGKFYEQMPVLKAEDSKEVRLAIVTATRQVIFNMLALLGIEALESM